jgi:hypothetical protein
LNACNRLAINCAYQQFTPWHIPLQFCFQMPRFIWPVKVFCLQYLRLFIPIFSKGSDHECLPGVGDFHFLFFAVQ